MQMKRNTVSLKTWFFITISTIITALLSFTTPSTAQRYKFTDLGTLPGHDESQAFGINNFGQIVGYSDLFPTVKAVLWEYPGITELWDYYAYKINDAGQAVGQMDGGLFPHAALWDNGDIIDIHDLGSQSLAGSLNDSTVVVGWYWAPMPFTGFIWEEGVMTTLEPQMLTQDINNLRQVVGFQGSRAVLWEDEVLTYLHVPPGTNHSRADAINDRSQIVGFINDGLEIYHAVLWEDGDMRALGNLGGPGSSANNITEQGDIIGGSRFTYDDTWWHGYFWHEGIMTDLNDLVVPPLTDGFIWRAEDINEGGVIVGTLISNLGLARAYRLTPIEGNYLTVRSIIPDVAGTSNTIEVIDATPNELVHLVFGTERSDVGIPVPGCLDTFVHILNPRLAGSAIADIDGKAIITRFVPYDAAGNQFVFQAVDQSSCRVSPTAWTKFQ
jgi:probable HAF family extracellular repeat protein